MTNESQLIDKPAIPKKIQRVIEAYDDMLNQQRALKNLQKITGQPMPAWKRRPIEEREAEQFMRFFNANGKWRELWDKLSKKDVAKAIEIKREIEGLEPLI